MVRHCIHLSLGTTVIAGCTDFTGAPDLPAGTQDPATFFTPDGAIGLYDGVLNSAAFAFSDVTVIGGLFTDELMTIRTSLSGTPGTGFYGRRFSPSGDEGDIKLLYKRLQEVRNGSAYAIAALARWAPDESPAFTAELYALQGYAELFLAEMFCSGVALSTIYLDTGFVYGPGFSTEDVYTRAIAHFDSAMLFAHDSIRIAHLARVGKGRALTALGRYSDADTVVYSVPESFTYGVPVIWRTSKDPSRINTDGLFSDNRCMTVADQKGTNGFPYVTGGDPRTRVIQEARIGPGTVNGNCTEFGPRFLPVKYAVIGPVPFIFANGIETRLMRAEAALQRGGGEWLTILNTLRTTGTYTIREPNDTVWQAGTGGVENLRRLQDPGTDSARVTMLFRERAAWLFLTGHRQGDLRRLVRNYDRLQEHIYPVGPFPTGDLEFGNDVTLPVSDDEYVNPNFGGCRDRNA